MRLLLAEDNRELAHWLEKALVQNGFAVDCVNDGRAADHLLQGENYAVAILDIGMPGFDVITDRICSVTTSELPSTLIARIGGACIIGRLSVDSLLARDLPMIRGTVIFMAVIFLAANLLVDISYGFFDPRIRYE